MNTATVLRKIIEEDFADGEVRILLESLIEDRGCGTGKGGFQKGNKCAKSGGGSSSTKKGIPRRKPSKAQERIRRSGSQLSKPSDPKSKGGSDDDRSVVRFEKGKVARNPVLDKGLATPTQLKIADRRIQEPKSAADFPKFQKQIEKHPHYRQVAYQLETLGLQTKGREGKWKDGDVRYWSKDKNTDAKGNYTPARKKLHSNIVKDLLNPKAAVPKGQRPKVVMLLGPPGAGKTTVGAPIAKKLAKEFTTINADDVKSRLPEYKGWNAGAVHEESSDIAEGKLFKAAAVQRHNMILDMTGKNGTKMKGIVKRLSKMGYDAHVVAVSIPSHKSASRAWKRFRRNSFGSGGPGLEPGRFVPPGYVHHGVGDKPRKTYSEMKKMPEVKSWFLADNDVPRGTPAKTLDQGSR